MTTGTSDQCHAILYQNAIVYTLHNKYRVVVKKKILDIMALDYEVKAS